MRVSVSVTEKVWKSVHSLVNLREIELSWAFESGSALAVVVNVLNGTHELLPDNI